MRQAQWIQWTRTRVTPGEWAELSADLTSEQSAHLVEHGYVFVEGVGVLWRPPHGGSPRRARFTHGTHFETALGQFYIEVGGRVRELPRAETAGGKVGA